MSHGQKLDPDKSWFHYKDIFDEDAPTVQLVLKQPNMSDVMLQMRKMELEIETLENEVRNLKLERNDLRYHLNEAERRLKEQLDPLPDVDALPMRDGEERW